MKKKITGVLIDHRVLTTELPPLLANSLELLNYITICFAFQDNKMFYL